ncbi:c-type cytochrome [Methylomonas montana]|uniref:c-type cytochrome n=1 Tax=Methylomonas montana TaxID=3058963 RepID=UPI002658AC66|nr:c-type cytochrome [Methylomonas montana]WKJ91378.1 c-type cytochrome [Methylomonas montana]
MNNKYHKIKYIVMLGLFAASANAADINAGKTSAAACQGCHGAAGISSSPLWPSLAGQSAIYIESQLNKFRTGQRDNDVMKPIAAGLSENDIQNVAAYYASLHGKSAAGGGDANLIKQGKDKAGMCLGCHGNNAQGMGMVPKLAGQQAPYLAKQLTDFKKGARKAPQMNAMAQSLSEEDIKALAAYLGSL